MIKRLALLALLVASPAFAYKLSIPELKIDLNTRKVVHLGDVEPKGLFIFKREYADAAKLPGDLIVLIQSDGGTQSIGEQMLQAIKAQQDAGNRVICVVETHAHSMAFNILTNCTIRVAKRTALLMFHRLAWEGWHWGRMTAPNMRKYADEIEHDDEKYRQANAKALGISLLEYDLNADRDQIWSASTLYSMRYLHALIP